MPTTKATIRLSSGLIAALTTPIAQAHHELESVAAERLLPSLEYTAVAIVLTLAALLVAVRRLRRRPGTQPVLENRE